MEHFCILHSQYFQTERKKQKARTVSVWRHFQSEPVFLRKQWIGWTKSPGCRGTYKITESRLVLTKPVPFRARRNWLAFCCNKNIISDIHYVTDSRHNGPLILFSRRRIVHIVLYNNTEPKKKSCVFDKVDRGDDVELNTGSQLKFIDIETRTLHYKQTVS